MTVKGYDGLFTEDEIRLIDSYIDAPVTAKTLYARMFFRRRYFFQKPTLKKYFENAEPLDTALRHLHRSGFIRSDEDVFFDLDLERIYELLNSMLLPKLKQLDHELKRIVPQLRQQQDRPFDFAMIENNVFHFPSQTFEGSF